MKKLPGYTTTADLPEALQNLYVITEPLPGGPVFDLPHLGQYGIDFSQLRIETAELLIDLGWPYLQKIVPNEFVEAPAAPRRRHKNDGETEEGRLEGE